MEEWSKFKYAYRTNPRFYLYYTHRDMVDRCVKGKYDGGGNRNRWLGLPLVPRAEFIDWALNDESFIREWNAWIESGYETRGPNIHRIDRDRGYEWGNMVFMSHVEKSKLTNKLRREKKDKLAK